MGLEKRFLGIFLDYYKKKFTKRNNEIKVTNLSRTIVTSGDLMDLMMFGALR